MVKIKASTSANRFYKSDGWTQAAVYDLFHSVDGQAPETTDMVHAEDRGEYYAVYGNRVIFDGLKVAQHEYIPYSGAACDRYFSQKNKVKEVDGE